MAKKEMSLPTMQEVVDFLQKQTKKTAKNEIARHFGVRGENRVYLKNLLKQIEKDGLIVHTGRFFTHKEALPERLNVEITGIDNDGELIARPVSWLSESPAPQIIVTKYHKLNPPPGVGDILQVKIKPVSSALYEGEAVRSISADDNQIVGVFYEGKIFSVERRFKAAFNLDSSFPKDLKPNDLLLVSISGGRQAHPVAYFIKKIGKSTDPKAAMLISAFAHHLPLVFPENALKEAKKAKEPQLGKRTDLRNLPFVTIDGADAKDFDDAVMAEKTENGYHVFVAIADVSWFVRYGSALDKEAFLRGNSTYFPQTVVPMLPEDLSNNLCSLMPGKDRACLVCELWLDKKGTVTKHQFLRALIKSHARLNYDEVQADFDGIERITGLEDLLDTLKEVYGLLRSKRQQRGVLEIDVPEYLVDLDEKGRVLGIRRRERFSSHQMIEELMILANVAAAQTLEKLSLPTMYRVHDRPSEEKLENLRIYLKERQIKNALGRNVSAESFNQLLKEADDGLQEMILRTQSQAVYSPENNGHFGLALSKYAHFTSPIRRYSDILVHRALVRGLNLGEGGLSDEEMAVFDKMASHISSTERNSASAEQDALDRYVASYLSKRIGEEFSARVSSITPFGLFVSLDDFGADGLVPLSHLGGIYKYDDKTMTLKNIRTKHVFTVGDRVEVILKEAVPLTGGLLFDIIYEQGQQHKSRPSHLKKAKNGVRRQGKSRRRGALKKK